MSEKRRPIGAIMFQQKGERAVKVGAVWPSTYKDGEPAPVQLSLNKEDGEYGKRAAPALKSVLSGEGFLVIYLNDEVEITVDGAVVAAAPEGKRGGGKKDAADDDFGF